MARASKPEKVCVYVKEREKRKNWEGYEDGSWVVRFYTNTLVPCEYPPTLA